MRFSLGILLLLVACAEVSSPEKIERTPVAFSDLPGWSSDHVAEVVPALLRSCAVNKKSEWVSICADIARLPSQDDAAIWAFFEARLQPYAVTGTQDNPGLFTGYYEPQLHGSLQQEGTYQTPLYALPDDWVKVDLGDFKKELHGQHIIGRVEGHAFKPYDDRAEIVSGSLQTRAQILAYVDDPIDAFFLEVQGSGNIVLPQGDRMQVGYAGANGRAYVAIGKALADQNLIEKPVTMQKIRDWLKANPERRDEILNLNPSYVFFRKIEGEGPIGAEGVALTSQRSLAVDPAFIPLGSLIWLDTTDSNGKPLQRLVMAQDTGGAIKGSMRGDFFWGSGDDAAAQAGAMQSKGRYYLLLPKDTKPNAD